MNAYQLGFDEIEIQTDAAKLGEGFNSLYLCRRPQARLFPERAIKKSIQEQTEVPTQKLEFIVAQSSRELATKLNIHAQAAAKYAGVGSAGGSADYLSEEYFSENRFVFCFRGLAVSRRVSLIANPELIKSAPGYLSDPETLLDTFGDYYCSELVYGGELVIFVTITTKDRATKQDMAAKLTTKFTAGLAKVSASVECQRSFTEATKDAETAVSLYQVGSTETPTDATFGTYLEYAFHYFEKEHTNNLMRAVYRPVTQLPGLEPASRRQLKKVLTPLWEKRDKYLEWLGGYQQQEQEYEEAFKTQSDYYLPTAYYNLIKQDLDDRIKAISDELRKNAGGLNLRDPHEVIPAGVPEYYERKLKSREIKESAYWGGAGGGEFSDQVTDLEGLTEIYLAWHSSSNGIFTCLQSRIIVREGTSEKTVENPAHGHGGTGAAERRLTVTLNQGDRIEGIQVRRDAFVRQITFCIRRKDTQELQQVGPFPDEPNPQTRWPGSVVNEKSNIILLGFHGRSGSWVDALGIKYIDLESSRSRVKPLKTLAG